MTNPTKIYRFRAVQDGTIVAILTLHDDRLDRALHAVLHSSPAIVWDAAAEAYDVDLAIANPPHLLPAPGLHAVAVKAVGRRADYLAQDPKWRGIAGSESAYRACTGWLLDYVADRPKGMKRGERGKHWRLTLEGLASELFFKSKREATAAIIAGTALAQLEAAAA